MVVGQGDPTPSTRPHRWGSSGEAGSEQHLRGMAVGAKKSHYTSTVGSGVTGVLSWTGTEGGRLKVSEMIDLLGMSKSLVFPPFRSSRWEKGLTRGGGSLVLAPP